MLGISQKVSEPTPYHLLGIDPRVFSEDLVESALAERKTMLRQNIPGPQFIPMISLVERDLDQAAGILLDADKRKALNDRLLGELRDKKAKKEKARRQKLRRAADKVIQGQVSRDGTLDDSKRQALAKRLQELGMSADDAQVVLEEIPRPMTKEEASPEALNYLAKAVNTALVGKVLTAEGEGKLLKLAKKLGIPKKQATQTILKSLEARQAKRGEVDETLLRAHFEKQVYRACPDGIVTDEHRAVLLRIAATIGLPARAAAEVFEGCRASAATMIVPSEPSSAVPPTEEHTPLRASLSAELDQLAETQPMRPLTRVRVQPKTGPVASNVKELAAALGIPTPKFKSGVFVKLRKLAGPAIPVVGVIVFWAVVMRYGGKEGPVAPQPLSPSLPKPRPVPALTVPQPQQPTIPGLKKGVAALLAALLRPGHSKEELGNIIAGAKLTDLPRAFASAASLLRDDSDLLGTCLAERLFARLIDVPGSPGTQASAVQALIGTIKTTPDLSRASRLANTVSLALYLQPLTSELATNNDRIAFHIKCQRDWGRSCTSSRQDPLNDLQRILSSILTGGDMMLYVKRVGTRQVLDLAAHLAEISRTPGDENATKATELLTAIATWKDAPAELGEVKKAAQLALCERLRSATDSDAAKETFSTLAKMLGIRRHPRSSLFASSDGRGQLADDIEKLINSGEEPAKASFASAGAGPSVSADRIRRGFAPATSAKPADLLLDVAVTMLAFCDRAMLFAAGHSACSDQLSNALANWNRASWLDSKVKLPEPVSASAPAAAPRPARRFLDDARLGELAKEIKSPVQAVRYAAIDELAAGNTAESAKVLVTELRALMASHEELNLPDPETATDCRILAALSTMDAPGLATQLTAMITQVVNPFFAHRITEALYEICGAKRAWRRTHVLPVVSTPEQRKMSQFKWKPIAARGHRVTTRRRSQPKRRQKAAPPPPWQPDPTKLRRMAAIVQYAELAAEALKIRTWDGAATGELSPPPDTIFATHEAGQDMLRHIDAIGVQLARLVRKHPNGTEHATTADMVDLEKKARTLASETTLQKIVVSLDAIGGLLEVLVQELHADDARKQKLQDLREKHTTAMLTASNAIDQMRQSCYHNVLLFDLVFQPE